MRSPAKSVSAAVGPLIGLRGPQSASCPSAEAGASPRARSLVRSVAKDHLTDHSTVNARQGTPALDAAVVSASRRSHRHGGAAELGRCLLGPPRDGVAPRRCPAARACPRHVIAVALEAGRATPVMRGARLQAVCDPPDRFADRLHRRAVVQRPCSVGDERQYPGDAARVVMKSLHSASLSSHRRDVERSIVESGRLT